MASSNNFVVRFSGDNIPIWRKDLQDDFLEVACDEAQLPNVNTATGTQTGLYTGLGSVDYAHTRIFTEVQLGFMLDADLTALKFLISFCQRLRSMFYHNLLLILLLQREFITKIVSLFII